MRSRWILKTTKLINVYFRVSGLSPFMGDTDLETMANVTIAEYDYDDECFDKVNNFRRTKCLKNQPCDVIKMR